MFYTIYKITNLINGKTYIGKHETRDLNDGYMGSGKLVRAAYDKYGTENFSKEIMFVFETEQEMNAKEKELVTEDFCLRDDTYNLCPGGNGGFGYINRNKLYGFSNPDTARKGREAANRKMEEKNGENWASILQKAAQAGRQAAHRRKWKVDQEYTERMRNATKRGIAAMNTEEVKLRKKEIYANIGHSQGNKNSQYGTIWITDGVNNKKIQSSDSIPDGWRKGRVINKK